MAVLLVACDAHRDFPDTAMKPCHILCTDGNVMSYADYEKSGKQAIAVVFHINQREDVEGNGYAVYLWDIAPESFADSIGVAQGTSADLTAYDGNTNTFRTEAIQSDERNRDQVVLFKAGEAMHQALIGSVVVKQEK